MAATNKACDGLIDRLSSEVPVNGAIVARLAITATASGLLVKRDFLWRAFIMNSSSGMTLNDS